MPVFWRAPEAEKNLKELGAHLPDYGNTSEEEAQYGWHVILQAIDLASQTVTVAGGHVLPYSLLVGADGASSVVRDAMTAQVRVTTITFYRQTPVAHFAGLAVHCCTTLCVVILLLNGCEGGSRQRFHIPLLDRCR